VKKTIGYGIKFSNESIEKAFRIYGISGLYDSREAARERIRQYKKNGDLVKGEKASVFKVTAVIV
jgi:hypothetical protein